MKKRQSPRNGIALTERAKDVLFGYGLLLPTFLVFSIVILYPIISAVIRSFCDYTFLTVNKPLKWNDFANYKTIFKNGFLTQLWTTMKFTVGTVGIELVLGMSIALLLNTKIRGRNALRSVFLMPWCIPSIVTALLWSWLFQAQYGIINYVLYGLGLISNPTAEWVLNPSTSLGVVTIAVVWRQTPYMLVSLIYRNLLSIETEELMARHPFDGIVLIGGCDKNIPAQLMAAVTVDKPTIFLPGGAMLPGNYKGETLCCGTDTFKLYNRYISGELTWQEMMDRAAALTV